MNDSPDEPTLPEVVNDEEEYNGSVSYLSKVIKEMEQSVDNYQKLESKVLKEKEWTKDKGLSLLEEFLSRIK